MWLQGIIFYAKDMLGEAETEALRAIEAFEKIGATVDIGMCRELLAEIDFDKLGLDGEDAM